MVGAPACGDVMRLQIQVNDSGVIEEARFKTYGCGSAIASSSLVTEWLKARLLIRHKRSRILILRLNSHYRRLKFTALYWQKMRLKQLLKIIVARNLKPD